MTALPYAKMNGIGNSILVVDQRGTGVVLSGDDARSLGADPLFRFDQLMAIGDARAPGTDAFVDIFNIDGSRAGACGNGTRCVAWVMDREGTRPILCVETETGLIEARRVDATTFAVDMGVPRFGWDEIPLLHVVADTADVELPDPPSPDLKRFSAVNMGNPHAVFFVPDADAIDLPGIGPRIERDPMFPERVNVSMATLRSRSDILLRVWERGAGATLACGSAACAVVVASVRAGLADREARVRLPGGDLRIEWRRSDDHVIMTGGTALEHEGWLPDARLGATR